MKRRISNMSYAIFAGMLAFAAIGDWFPVALKMPPRRQGV